MSGSEATILIVEDNPDHAELIEATILDCEPLIKILSQRNGEDALQYLTTTKHLNIPLPDLIFMDIKMPRMNGIETLIAIKQDPQLRFMPVVMLSTSTNEAEMRICMKSGAEIYLAKPLQTTTFEELIRPLLDRWRSVPPHKNSNRSQ